MNYQNIKKKKSLNIKTNSGFTLPELLVIVAILVILTGLAIPTFLHFREESDLNDSAEEIINTLRVAQNKTLASEGASQWGVYFNTSTSPHQYTLFQGSSYGSRTTSSDEIHKLPQTVEIYEISLWGGNTALFQRITGFASSTDQIGRVSLRLRTNLTKTRTIEIETSGRVGLE